MADPVLTLAIETSNPSSGGEPGVALGMTSAESCDALGVEPLGSGERHDDLLMPAIDRLFTHLGHKPHELHRIAVSVGPGGFTGLRIATSAANLIALSTGADVVAVPSAAVVAQATTGRGPLVVCLASKGVSAWVTRFDAKGQITDAGSLRTADELGLSGDETLVGDRFLPETFREAAERAGCGVAEPVFDPAACLALAWAFPARQAGEVAPLYGREAEAVTRWRELHGSG
ncbi:MAG: tRNA (adenosine(37)-N6)-threonylcarbamoyltransferase complex dimerization subunit type 1 TsaB [Planctomycetota bacterium]